MQSNYISMGQSCALCRLRFGEYLGYCTFLLALGLTNALSQKIRAPRALWDLVKSSTKGWGIGCYFGLNLGLSDWLRAHCAVRRHNAPWD